MVLFHCLTVPRAESKIAFIRSPTSPTRVKILSLRFSPRYSLPRSFLRELSLEQLDYLGMHVHHLQEQTQKTTVWCSIEWVSRTKTDGYKLTNKLEEVQTMWSAGPKLQQGRGAERRSHLLVLQRYKLIPGSREPPFHKNTDFSERLTGINSPQSNSQQ